MARARYRRLVCAIAIATPALAGCGARSALNFGTPGDASVAGSAGAPSSGGTAGMSSGGASGTGGVAGNAGSDAGGFAGSDGGPAGASGCTFDACAPPGEPCDGIDNDCDGVVDNPVLADPWCASNAGSGMVCRGAVCVCPLTCAGQCAGPDTDAHNCGGCGKACPVACAAGHCVGAQDVGMGVQACTLLSGGSVDCWGGRIDKVGPPPLRRRLLASRASRLSVSVTVVGVRSGPGAASGAGATMTAERSEEAAPGAVESAFRSGRWRGCPLERSPWRPEWAFTHVRCWRIITWNAGVKTRSGSWATGRRPSAMSRLP